MLVTFFYIRMNVWNLFFTFRILQSYSDLFLLKIFIFYLRSSYLPATVGDYR